MIDLDLNEMSETTKVWHPGVQVLILIVAFIAHFAQGWGFDDWYNVIFKILAIASTFFLTIINFKKALDIVVAWFEKAIKFFK